MRYSKLFPKTIKDAPADEVSVNSKLLYRGGFIRREVAGVYNFLPLGFRVIEKITNIVREEMNATGAQQLELSSIQNKESWKETNRWDSFDVLFKLASQFEHEFALGPTHEEVIVPLVKNSISSYKDLPLYLYQIQTKFRDEARAKSGILRGREFLMKDLYSFHTDEKDFESYYETMKKAYKKVFSRMDLSAIETEASGGAFSDFSHEYQVITPAGEDEIIYCPRGDYSANVEVSDVKLPKECDLGHGPLEKVKTIEVGNIFPLGTKFSDAFNLVYKDKDGADKKVIMGCYGIGISRLMGAIVEVHHDEKGIIWPESVAPYQAHLVGLSEEADKVYEKLENAGVEVLYDDRADKSPGEKFADADLLGIPTRLVVSKKTDGKLEWKNRSSDQAEVLTIEEVLSKLS